MKKYIMIFALMAFTISSYAYTTAYLGSNFGTKTAEYVNVYKFQINYQLDAWGTAFKPMTEAWAYSPSNQVLGYYQVTKFQGSWVSSVNYFPNIVYKVKLMVEPDINVRLGDWGVASAYVYW